MRVAVPRAWIRARRTILSADTVSFLAAAILYYFASADVKGFAFTLGLSTILDLVVVFLFTHPIVSLLSRSRAFGSTRFTGLDSVRTGPALPDEAPDRRSGRPSRAGPGAASAPARPSGPRRAGARRRSPCWTARTNPSTGSRQSTTTSPTGSSTTPSAATPGWSTRSRPSRPRPMTRTTPATTSRRRGSPNRRRPPRAAAAPRPAAPPPSGRPPAGRGRAARREGRVLMSKLRALYRGETSIDFIRSRRRWYAASAVLVLICVLSFIFRGFNYGIEFKGGTTFTIPDTASHVSATAGQRRVHRRRHHAGGLAAGRRVRLQLEHRRQHAHDLGGDAAEAAGRGGEDPAPAHEPDLGRTASAATGATTPRSRRSRA